MGQRLKYHIMTRNFFITGLPRSRTAWLSVLLSDQDSFCYHELLSNCQGISEFHKKLSNPFFNKVGNSDSGLSLYWDKIKNYYKNCPLILIYRNEQESLDSLKNSLKLSQEQAEFVIEYTSEKLKTLDPTLTVYYEDLDNYEICNDIFKHIINKNLKYEKWEALNKLNITVELPKLNITKSKEVLECLGLEL